MNENESSSANGPQGMVEPERFRESSSQPGPSRRKRVRAWFYACLTIYFGLHVLIRTCMSDSLELDEAEQAFLSQWFLLGYGSKPPLYTWLQIGFNSVFGFNVLSLSLLKNTLLFATYALVFESGRILLKEDLRAALAAASMILLPQIGWESQRDLTHSVLVTALGAAAVYAALVLARDRRTSGYIATGLAFGLGAISKYNFALLGIALLMVMALRKQSRAVLMDRRALWIPGLLILISAPYYAWFLLHLDVAAGSVGKLDPAASNWLLPGILHLVEAFVAFLSPLWIVFLLIFALDRSITLPWRKGSRPGLFVFHMYFAAVLGLFLAGIAIFHITEIKARWMQPLLFIFPVYLFCLLKADRRIPRRAFKRYAAAVAAAAGLVLLLIPLRVVLGPAFGYTTNFNIPYSGLAARLDASLPAGGLVLAPGSTLAGNLRLHMPKTRVLDPVMASQVRQNPPQGPGAVAIAWSAADGRRVPAAVRRYLEGQAGFRLRAENVQRLALEYKYAPADAQKHVFYYLLSPEAD
jgi:4-amino-4-deoxy-L-arabinose transferase-like glycosyltransferase